MTYDLSPNQVVKQHPKWIRIKANAPVGMLGGVTNERMNEWTNDCERTEPKHTPHKQSKWKTILYRL